MIHTFRLIFLLTLVYLALSANIEFGNILLGIFLAVGVVILLRPVKRDVKPGRFFKILWAFLQYAGILLLNLFKSGMYVARIVMTPSIRIQPGILEIPSGTKSSIVMAMSAHAITLTPGELVIETDDDGVLYTHSLDVRTAETYVYDDQKKRRRLLERIFS